MKKSIYASISQAIRLKNAGFDKVCTHKAVSYSDMHTPFGAKVYAHGVEIDDLKDVEPFEGTLWLPTAEEIELPKSKIVLEMLSGKYGVFSLKSNDFDELAIFHYLSAFGEFDTKLDATIAIFIFYFEMRKNEK